MVGGFAVLPPLVSAVEDEALTMLSRLRITVTRLGGKRQTNHLLTMSKIAPMKEGGRDPLLEDVSATGKGP